MGSDALLVLPNNYVSKLQRLQVKQVECKQLNALRG